MKRCLNCMKEYEEQEKKCPHCGYVEGTSPKEIYYLLPGTILNNRYIIGTSCGAGGFGTVYRAWDHNLDKMVAIKEYYPTSIVGRAPGEKLTAAADYISEIEPVKHPYDKGVKSRSGIEY